MSKGPSHLLWVTALSKFGCVAPVCAFVLVYLCVRMRARLRLRPG